MFCIKSDEMSSQNSLTSFKKFHQSSAFFFQFILDEATSHWGIKVERVEMWVAFIKVVSFKKAWTVL